MRYGKAALLVGFCGVAFGTSQPASAVLRTWDGSTDNNWNWLFNWSGNDVPDDDDTALIGAGVPNNAVVLNANTATIDGLTVTGGASLNTNGFRLLVDNVPNTALVTIGNGSSLIVTEVAGSPATSGMDTDRLTVQANGTFGSIGRSVIDDILVNAVNGTIASIGTIEVGVAVGSASAFNNNGTLISGFLGGGDLTIVAGAGRTLDLDGTTGNGIVRATGDAFLGGISDANLTIDGPLSDDFGGTMEIARRDSITFTDAWTKNGGQLIFRGEDGTDAADLNGATLTNSGGVIQVDQGAAVFNARLNMTGGEFFPAGGTTTNFSGGATFGAGATFNTSALGGAKEFNVRSIVTIQQATLDLDGNSGSDVWNVGANQQLRIASNFSDPFDGTVNMASGSTLTLDGSGTFNTFSTLNMDTMDVTLNIGGDVTIFTDVDLDGNILFQEHTVNLTSSGASLTLNGSTENDDDIFSGTINNRGTLNINTNNRPASSGWANGGTINLIDVGTDPVINGNDIYNADGNFGNSVGLITGRGTINNRVFNRDGAEIVPGSANTAGRLVFSSLLRVDDGEIEFDLGGLTPGTQHDQITGGSLTLYTGSRIDLDLIGGYLPAMYVEHVLADVTALGNLDVFNFVEGIVIPATGTGLAVTYDYAADQILVQRALLGDANLNMQVEQGDLDAVLTNWGQTGTTHGTSWVTGDMNGNGIVEQGDLDFVLGNWGDTAAPDFGGFDLSQVPEPSTAAGMILTACLLSRRNRPRAGHAA